MRSWLMPLFLAALLLSSVHSVAAQESPSADQERKARIESRFADVTRYREARRWELCIDTLDDIIMLAKVHDGSGQKNDAALSRADYEMAWVRSLISGQAAELVALMKVQDEEIIRTEARFAGATELVETWERPDRSGALAAVSSGVERTSAYLQQDAFARDRVAALAAMKRSGERVARLSGEVCRARSQDAAGSAVDDIAGEQARDDPIRQQAERWRDRRNGQLPDSPVGPEHMRVVDEGVRGFEGYPAVLDSLLAQVEQSRTKTRTELEQALGALRPQVEQLSREQQEFETLLRLYRRTGEFGTHAEDRSAEWQRDAPGSRVTAARGRIASLEKTLQGLQQWDATGARAAVAKTRTDIERLVARWSELNTIITGTDATAQAVMAGAMEIRRQHERASACLSSIGTPAGTPSPAAAAPPAPQPAVASTAAAAVQNAATAGAVTPRLPPAQHAVPAGANAAAPTASRPPPPVDPDVFGGLKIQGPTTRIGVGQRVQFVATDYGNRPYAKVTWSSFDDELLSLDSQGWATGLKPGALLIQALLDDEKVATLNVEVVDRAGAPIASTAPAQPPVPAATTPTAQPSGFQAGATQAGPARPSTETPTPAPTSPPVTPATDTHRGGASLLGVETQAAPTPPATERTQGFEVGATLAGSDLSQPPPQAARGSGPPPRGGGQPGGSGGGSPPRGSPPPGPPQTRAVAGQPAAYHIFATGSRLGWASGLGQYSIGPADGSIIEHLQVAGEHVLWANRESYPPVKAWPNWTANRAEMRSWADGLVRDPRNETRRQISISANSRAATLADELRYQTMGTVEHVATCDAAYMSLGYELGYAQQVLGIADEAARNGDAALAQKAQRDGMSHLQNSLRILAEYERTGHLTGRCADLRDVRTRLDAIWRVQSGELSGQSSATTAAWTLALERIVALRDGQPGAVVQTPPPPIPTARPQAGPTRAPSQGLDPGELEGTWFECGSEFIYDAPKPDSPRLIPRLARCLAGGPDQARKESGRGFTVEFNRNGTQYAGKVARDSQTSDSVREAFWGAAFRYQPAAEVFRLTRTASGTYEGEIFDCPGCVPGDPNPGEWVATKMTVEGDVAREYYFAHASHDSSALKVYWVRWPPRHQGPASQRPAP